MVKVYSRSFPIAGLVTPQSPVPLPFFSTAVLQEIWATAVCCPMGAASRFASSKQSGLASHADATCPGPTKATMIQETMRKGLLHLEIPICETETWFWWTGTIPVPSLNVQKPDQKRRWVLQPKSASAAKRPWKCCTSSALQQLWPDWQYTQSNLAGQAAKIMFKRIWESTIREKTQRRNVNWKPRHLRATLPGASKPFPGASFLQMATPCALCSKVMPCVDLLDATFAKHSFVSAALLSNMLALPKQNVTTWACKHFCVPADICDMPGIQQAKCCIGLKIRLARIGFFDLICRCLSLCSFLLSWKRDIVEIVLEAQKALPHPIGTFCVSLSKLCVFYFWTFRLRLARALYLYILKQIYRNGVSKNGDPWVMSNPVSCRNTGVSENDGIQVTF